MRPRQQVSGRTKELVSRLRRRWFRWRVPHRAFCTAGAVLQTVDEEFRYSLRVEVDALDALAHNVEVVLEILQDVGVDGFAVEHRLDAQPALGIVRSDLAAVWSGLREAGRRTPLYCRASTTGDRGRYQLFATAAETAPEEVSTISVFQHLQHPVTRRRYGERFACELEIWDEVGDDLTNDVPHPTRARIVEAHEHAERATADMAGRKVPTFAALLRPSPFDVSFPVDLVYLWVDGSDPSWQERKARRAGLEPSNVEASHPARYRQFDELRYSLRSVARYAPWARRIHVVTDQQRPAWLVEDDRLRVVDHSEIFPVDALPTFNSHAITASVHRIPGLTDRFLLMNDDVLFGRPVPPERFFLANGVTLFFLSRSSVSETPVAAHEVARLRTRDLIEERCGLRPDRLFQHTPVALSRPLLEDLSEELSEWWEATVRSPFRSPTDVVPSWLHHYLGFARRATMPSTISYGYVGVGDHAASVLAAFARLPASEVYCVNDVGDDVTHDRSAKAMRAFFDRELPHPSPWER